MPLQTYSAAMLVDRTVVEQTRDREGADQWVEARLVEHVGAAVVTAIGIRHEPHLAGTLAVVRFVVGKPSDLADLRAEAEARVDAVRDELAKAEQRIADLEADLADQRRRVDEARRMAKLEGARAQHEEDRADRAAGRLRELRDLAAAAILEDATAQIVQPADPGPQIMAGNPTAAADFNRPGPEADAAGWADPDPSNPDAW